MNIPYSLDHTLLIIAVFIVLIFIVAGSLWLVDIKSEVSQLRREQKKHSLKAKVHYFQLEENTNGLLLAWQNHHLKKNTRSLKKPFEKVRIFLKERENDANIERTYFAIDKKNVFEIERMDKKNVFSIIPLYGVPLHAEVR